MNPIVCICCCQMCTELWLNYFQFIDLHHERDVGCWPPSLLFLGVSSLNNPLLILEVIWRDSVNWTGGSLLPPWFCHSLHQVFICLLVTGGEKGEWVGPCLIWAESRTIYVVADLRLVDWDSQHLYMSFLSSWLLHVLMLCPPSPTWFHLSAFL